MPSSRLLANLGLEDDAATHEAWEDADSIARLIRTLVGIRNDKKLTQAQIAEAMGTTQSAVSDLERTAGDPRLSTVQRYARAAGVKVCLTVSTKRQPYVARRVIEAGRSGRPDSAEAVASWRRAAAA